MAVSAPTASSGTRKRGVRSRHVGGQLVERGEPGRARGAARANARPRARPTRAVTRGPYSPVAEGRGVGPHRQGHVTTAPARASATVRSFLAHERAPAPPGAAQRIPVQHEEEERKHQRRCLWSRAPPRRPPATRDAQPRASEPPARPHRTWAMSARSRKVAQSRSRDPRSRQPAPPAAGARQSRGPPARRPRVKPPVSALRPGGGQETPSQADEERGIEPMQRPDSVA